MPGGGPRALHIDDHERHFGHGGQAEQLDHQGKARPAGRSHGLEPTAAGADHGADRRDLVLQLHHRSAERRQVPSQPFHDLRGRRDGVAAEIAQARRDGTKARGLGAREDHPCHTVIARGKLRGGVRDVLFVDQPHADPEGLEVRRHDVRALGLPAVADESLGDPLVQVDQARERPEHDDVLGDLVPDLAHREVLAGHADCAKGQIARHVKSR